MIQRNKTRRRVAGVALAVAMWAVAAWGQNATTGEVSAHADSKAEAPSKKVDAKYDVSKIGSRNVGGGMNMYSLEREMALGRQLASEVDQNSKFVTDPAVTEYVNRIGQGIVRNSDAKVPFVIKVIDDDTVNAFALPGGFFYVDSGLILAADSEAELAAVMAHEIAHVAARHATRNATKNELLNLASIPLIFIGGPSGYAIRSVAALAVPLSFLRFSRSAEREADMLGLQYQYASGYDPQAFVEFFERLQAQEKKHSFLAKTFSTHPMTAARVKSAQQEIAKYLPDRPQYVVTTSEFEEVKARLSGLMNIHRLNGGNEARPTLRQRGGSEPVDAAPADASGAPSSGDEDERPILRRNPGADSSASSAPPADTGASSGSGDEQRPTLKKAPQ